ncbi:4Fe-4S binding protein [Desulfovulcanus sp.]
MGLCITWILLCLLIFTKKSWVRYILAAALIAGSLVWLKTGIYLLQFRMAFGLPWLRLGLIMFTVLGLMLFSLFLILGRKGQIFFSKEKQKGPFQGAAFLITTLALALAEAKTNFPILLANRFHLNMGWTEIFFLALYAAWITGKMLEQGGSIRVRPRIWALFSLVFFLQLFLGLLGIEEMLMTGKLHLPVPALIVAGPIYRGTGFFMIVLFSLTVLLVGPAWCSHLCYIGAWDDMASRKVKKIRHLPRWAKWIQFFNLILVIAVALIMRIWGVSWTLALFSASIFGLVGLGVMLLVSSRRGQLVHCTAYCPMGLVSNILGRISPWRIKIDSRCDRCGRCVSVCRYGALSDKDLQKGRPNLSCTLCGDCLGVCKKKYIHLKFPGLSPEMARKVFVVMIVSLHAVFLGVARI